MIKTGKDWRMIQFSEEEEEKTFRIEE